MIFMYHLGNEKKENGIIMRNSFATLPTLFQFESRSSKIGITCLIIQNIHL